MGRANTADTAGSSPGCSPVTASTTLPPSNPAVVEWQRSRGNNCKRLDVVSFDATSELHAGKVYLRAVTERIALAIAPERCSNTDAMLQPVAA